jgi:hypothetical protein
LIGKGMDAGPAGRAAMALLDKAVIGQSAVIAFDTAFNAVSLIFVFAAPVLVAFRICLHRFAHKPATLEHRSGKAERMAEWTVILPDRELYPALIPLSATARRGMILSQSPLDGISAAHLQPR